MATASLVLGIIAFVFSLLPFLSGWFLALTFLVWILALLAIVFGIIGLCKSQSVGKCVVGLVLSVLSVAVPYIFAETFASNALESVSNAVERVNALDESLDID